MLRKANNVFSVLVDDNSNTTLPAAGSVVTAANIGNGAVCLVNLGMVRLDAVAFAALADTDKFMLVQGKGASAPLMMLQIEVNHLAYLVSLKQMLLQLKKN